MYSNVAAIFSVTYRKLFSFKIKRQHAVDLGKSSIYTKDGI